MIRDLIATDNVFLFIPNIIGYARIVLAIISFWFMPTNYVIAGSTYLLSVFLDCMDGHAARYFNQCTKFGALLDQLTDRCGTMCLLVTLSLFYPSYMFLFQLSMAIDVAGHWIFLHTSQLQGKQSHKFVDPNESTLIRLYYTKEVLFPMCVGNELFYASLYLLHFTTGPVVLGLSLFKLIAWVCLPVAIGKTYMSLLHMQIACQNLGIIDTNERKKALDSAAADAAKRAE